MPSTVLQTMSSLQDKNNNKKKPNIFAMVCTERHLKTSTYKIKIIVIYGTNFKCSK